MRTVADRLYSIAVQRSHDLPTVVISARGEERLRGGHPWIYRADVADARAAAGDIVQVRSPRGQALGSALFSDRSQITLRMLTYGESVGRRGAGAAADRGGDRVPRVARHRRDGVPAGPRRSRSAAVADRRSLRRLPGRAGAVAGDGPAAAGGRVDADRAAAPARHPGAQRSARARCSKGWSSASTCSPARCPRA